VTGNPPRPARASADARPACRGDVVTVTRIVERIVL
jgi:hypothetical protein